MSVNQWIEVAGIVVASLTTILVAYLHRKQLRQVEEFRRHPDVGLKPPPGRAWTLAKRYALLAGVLGLLVLVVGMMFASRQPVTLWSVLEMSATVAQFFSGLLLYLVLRVVEAMRQGAEISQRASEEIIAALREATPARRP